MANSKYQSGPSQKRSAAPSKGSKPGRPVRPGGDRPTYAKDAKPRQADNGYSKRPPRPDKKQEGDRRKDRFEQRRGGTSYETPAFIENEEVNPYLLMGRNPVIEALKNGRQMDKILMLSEAEGSIKRIVALAAENHVQIQYVERATLDRLTNRGVHQGVVAYTPAYDYCELEDILEAAKAKGEEPFVILLDGLEDPHNLGAILRTADAVGAHGVVIPNRRSVGLTETVAKASAGAIEHVPVARVANLVQTMEKLKAAGLWIGACDMDGQNYHQAKLTGGIAVVFGGEGQGVGRLIKEKCDFVVSLPMRGHITSLNASNAAAVLLYEVLRQRELK